MQEKTHREFLSGPIGTSPRDGDNEAWTFWKRGQTRWGRGWGISFRDRGEKVLVGHLGPSLLHLGFVVNKIVGDGAMEHWLKTEGFVGLFEFEKKKVFLITGEAVLVGSIEASVSQADRGGEEVPSFDFLKGRVPTQMRVKFVGVFDGRERVAGH